VSEMQTACLFVGFVLKITENTIGLEAGEEK
jgi:hypothetical protein